MQALHFHGRADAYLEWAQATGFAWVVKKSAHAAGSNLSPNPSPSPAHPLTLLVQQPAAPQVAAHTAPQTVAQQALSAFVAALPPNSWVELAQALAAALSKPVPAMQPPPVVSAPQPSAPVVLACIDSGLGSAWFKGWQRSQPQRHVDHWDMDAACVPAQPQPHATHGAHVLSWLAGQPPYAGGGWHADAASQCPLVVVNLPQDAVQDPTGRWLGHHILDGLDFAIRQATARQAQRLVVSISWGPQTGPHDGHSLLEQALAQRIDAAAQQHGLQLDVVLAAGNSRESRAHAQFAAATGYAHLVWAVPPASRVPFFMEIWWPPGTDIDNVCIDAQAPDGQWLHLHGEGLLRGRHACGVLLRYGSSGARPMALLALNPTDQRSGAAAHGRWRVSVPGMRGATGTVHVYVARQAANMGARYRGPDSHLEDPQAIRNRSGRTPNGTCVTPAGTLSGLATADHARLHVVGGAIKSTGMPAPYSSEGPSVGAAALARPDWALPTDDTPLLQGLLGAGSRPGSVVRLVGTSMAAPQWARLLVNGTAPPRPTPSAADPRTGAGVLLAPAWISRQRPPTP